jgi:hypothetical protein
MPWFSSQKSANPSKKFVYVPGLARDGFLRRGAFQKDVDLPIPTRDFIAKVNTVFVKTESDAGTPIHDRADGFMTDVVQSLMEKEGAQPMYCNVALAWIRASITRPSGPAPPPPKQLSKAFKILGAPGTNSVRKELPKPPPPPGSLAPGDPMAPINFGVAGAEGLRNCIPREWVALPIRRDPNRQGALQILQSNDVLFIVGHGGPQGGTLTYKTKPDPAHLIADRRDSEKPVPAGQCGISCHFDSWSVDPMALANLLIEDGLPKGHRYIVMVMCFGAGLSTVSEQKFQPYCERLAACLRGRGYAKLEVKGPAGMIMGDTLAVKAELSKSDGRITINSFQKGTAHTVNDPSSLVWKKF